MSAETIEYIQPAPAQVQEGAEIFVTSEDHTTVLPRGVLTRIFRSYWDSIPDPNFLNPKDAFNSLRDGLIDDRAPCKLVDPETFEHNVGERYRQAVSLCGLCSIKASCLNYALRNNIKGAGVWGGMNQEQRLAEARKRRHSFLSN